MGFIGRIDDMPVADIVQMLAMSQRTGLLTLTRGVEKASIVFRRGEVVNARSDECRDHLGQMLLHQQVITEATLNLALQVQQRLVPAKPLGSVLLEMQALAPGELVEVVRRQVERVFAHVVSWESGSFKFDPQEPEACANAEAEASQVGVAVHFSAESLVLNAARSLDEAVKDGVARPVPAPLLFTRERMPRQETDAGSERENGGQPGIPIQQVLEALAGAERGPRPLAIGNAEEERLRALHAIMEEFRSPSFLGEVALMVMRAGAGVVERGLLFARFDDHMRGMGQYGLQLGGVNASERIRAARFPLNQRSVFADVVELRRSIRGELAKTYWNDHLVWLLGGQRPADAVVVPLIVFGDVWLVFYGDNHPTGTPIGSLETLEVLMIYAGLAMESTRLRGRAPENKRPGS